MRRPLVRTMALAAACAAALAGPALAAKDDVVLISRATGPAGAPVNATAFSPFKFFGRRAGRLQQRREQPLGRGRQRRRQRLRARPGRQHDHAGQPRDRRRGRARHRRLLHPQHLGRRQPGRLPVGSRQPLGRGRRRRRQRLRARPRRQHDHAGQPRLGVWGRGRERGRAQPGHLGRRALRRLPVGSRQPLGQGRRRRRQRLRARPRRQHDHAGSAAPLGLGARPRARPRSTRPSRTTGATSSSGR